MARTTVDKVREVLESGQNYDSDRQPSLKPYIDGATLIIDRVRVCAATKGITLTAAELEMMERYLAAHRYCRSDPLFQTGNTADASATFVTPKDADTERYKATAIESDPSGCLNAILNRKVASAAWLGKNANVATPYDQR